MSSTPLSILLSLPRLQMGFLKMTQGIEDRLKPYLSGEPSETPTSSCFPLELRDGVAVDVPFTVPMIGACSISFSHQAGTLWLGVPNLPFVTGTVFNNVATRIDPSQDNRLSKDGRNVEIPLLMRVGDRLAVPLAMFGEIAVEVTA